MGFNKFIVVKSEESSCKEIIFGNVIQHSELAVGLKKGTEILGGGFFVRQEGSKVVKLHGDSFDYGFPDLNGCVCIRDGKYGFSKKDACEFYYLPDLFMPIRDDYKVHVEFIDN